MKYAFVGGVAFVFDFSTLYLLTEKAGFHYLISAGVAFIIGLNVNYFLAKFLVFKESKIKSFKVEYSWIVFISVTALFLNQLLLWFLTDVIAIYYLVSKLIAAAIILTYNFFIRKIFIFN